MTEFTNELTVAPTSALAVDYALSWNGVPLARTRDTHGPRRACFAIDGRELFVAEQRPRATSLVAAVARSVLQRSAFELRDADGAVLATATQRGWWDAGYDVAGDAVGAAGELRWLSERNEYAWFRDGREAGRAARLPGLGRGVVARVDDATSRPVAAFLALLALARWETVERSDAV